jgi:membrane-associated phospholipid phosphatase
MSSRNGAEGAAAPGRPPARRRVARLVTEVLAPAPIVAALLLVVAWRSASTTTEAMAWGLLAVLFASLLPFLFILRGVWRGRLSDHHVGIRQQRPMPLLVGIASVLIGLGLLTAWSAPRDLVALVGAMTVGLVVSLLVTLGWKISIHTAVAAGAAVILVLVFGPPLLALSPVVGLIGWSRVEIGDHTPAQVAMGAVLGAVVAAGAFSLLR